jgi:xylulokinase
MDAVGHPVRLMPDAGPSLGLAGQVTPEAAQQTGIPAGVPVAYGGGDQAMAALALGLTDRSLAAVAISSGGTIFKCTSAPLGPEHGLHVMPYVRPHEWMAMGVVLAGGLAIDWLAGRLLGEEPTSKRISALMSEANSVPKGAEGLIASPHLGGTRTPVVEEGARAHLSGLGFQHGQAHVARALVEGVCVALCACLARMQFAGDPAQALIVSGGGARFPLWRQTLADVSGLPVRVSSDLEHPALGAALAGAAAVNEPVAFAPATRIAMTIEPDPAAGDIYADVAERLTRLEAAARTGSGS